MLTQSVLGRDRWSSWRIAGALLGVAWSLCACEPPQDQAEVEPTLPPPPVRVLAMSPQVLSPQAVATAEIASRHTAELAVETGGRVVAILFENGERVKRGQLLARLDVGRVNASVAASGAAIEQALARLAQAKRERALSEKLLAGGSGSQQQLDNARDGENLAAAALAAARAQQQVTRRGLDESVLRAPFAGVIARRYAERGEFLGPGGRVAQLVDPEDLTAQLQMDPVDALKLKVGASVELTVQARPDERFVATVEQVGEVVDRRTRRLPVRVAIEDPKHRLRPGLLGRFAVRTGAPRKALLVDASAVFQRHQSHYVYVVEEGVARRRPVQVGERRDERVELTSGVQPGDQVIVEGQERVVPERPVLIVEPDVQGARAESR